MKFFVTVGRMNARIANPFGHLFLMPSYLPAEGEKLQVMRASGFYGGPVADPNSFVSRMKAKLGLRFDFFGNHGEMKDEEVRYLDLGYGLEGITFEISLEQYLQLQSIIKEKIRLQEEAIKELSARLNTQNHAEIFAEEIRLAALEGRKARLEPFDIKVSLNENGVLTLEQSNACKKMVITILREIGIEEKYLERITQNNTSMTIPRWSGKMEPILLHSVGPRLEYVSERSGKHTLYRSWKKKEDRVYWSRLPQEIITNSQQTRDYFRIDKDQIRRMDQVISRLQQLEHTIVNAQVDAAYFKDNQQLQTAEASRLRLIDNIVSLYTPFSTINSKTPYEKIDAHIQDAKTFLNNLYFAINDRWESDEEVETIAAYFPTKVQYDICHILGRSMAQCSPNEMRRVY